MSPANKPTPANATAPIIALPPLNPFLLYVIDVEPHFAHAGAVGTICCLTLRERPFFLAHIAQYPLYLAAVELSIFVEHSLQVTLPSVVQSTVSRGRSREQYLHTIASFLISSAQNGHFFSD